MHTARPIARCPRAFVGLTAFAIVTAVGLTQGCAGAASGPVVVSTRVADTRLEGLAVDFYGRLANRRIDSIATYQDPSLREYFRTEDAFADYYADLVQVLADAYVEARRLTRVVIEEVELAEPDATIRVRMRGENGRPLRWWSTEVVREDRWRRDDAGRWWIEPGKV